MSKLDDLKKRIGRPVYFSQPVLSLSKGGYTIEEGTLISIEGHTCVVEWYECLCLEPHDESVPCRFVIRGRLSTFVVSPTRRCAWQQ